MLERYASLTFGFSPLLGRSLLMWQNGIDIIYALITSSRNRTLFSQLLCRLYSLGLHMAYYPYLPKVSFHASSSFVLYHFITISNKMSLLSLMHGFSFPTPEDGANHFIVWTNSMCQSLAVPVLSPVLKSRKIFCCHSFFFHGSSSQEIKAALVEREAMQKERPWRLRKCE